MAERIRNLIASNPVNISNGINITITVSIGVATYPENSDNATDLFIAADAAAYAAKESGRNRVCMAETVAVLQANTQA